MIKLALKHGVALTVIVAIVCVFGFISLFRVPIQMTPDLTVNAVSVITVWPGATPQDIEKEIVIEQERFLRSIPNLDKMTATCSTGRAEIVLEFKLGVSLDEILVRVNNAISQVPSYPENVDQPRLVASSASDQPIAWFSVRPLDGNPKSIDIVAMQDFLEDNVQMELERTFGVSQGEIFGGAPRQLRLYVDPGRLAQHNISVGELRNALRARNRDVSGGDLDEGKRRYLVRTLGRFETVEEVESTLIARRGGTPIYLRDIGRVELDRAEIGANVRHNGNLAVAMNVRRQPGTNILEVMDSVKETVERLNGSIMQDEGMVIRQVSDDTLYIREAVSLVRNNLLLGGFLATLILLLFLRSLRATFIGALAVPICTISSFLGLTLAGRTINVISLAGIAFAIGMTLDNSIVVLENIDRHRRLGKGPWEAAKTGVGEVWGAVLASTLTTVIVFLPIAFIEEEAGQLFTDIAVAISSAIFFSMLVAISVIPSASARLLTTKPANPTGDNAKNGGGVHGLFGIVAVSLRFREFVLAQLSWLLKTTARRLVLVGAMASLSIVIALLLVPKTEYLPDGSKNLLFAVVIPPSGYSLGEMAKIGDEIEEFFVPYVQTDPEDYRSGKSEVPAIQEFFFVSTNSNMFIVTKTVDPADLDALSGIITEKLSEVPGMVAFTIRASIFSGGLSGTRGIEIDIASESLESLFAVGGAAIGRVLTHERIGGNYPQPEPRSERLGQPLLEIRPDWVRAAELGIDAGELGYLVWAMADGAYIDEFFLGDDKIDMYLYSSDGTVGRTQDLYNLPLYSSNGGTVPLGSVASIVETVSTETIRRVDRRRTYTLTVVPPTEVALEEAVEIIERDIIQGMKDAGEVPADVTMRVAGASDKLKATREALGGNMILAVVISYLLMVALFSHWGFPFLIMMSLPLGIVGGVFGLHLINHAGSYFGWLGASDVYQPLDVLTMLGFVVLLGTVVNNPILLVERSLQAMREQDGITPREAVLDATRTRFRPIMMSTLTTTFGLLPLVLVPGSGAELYRGLGTVVLFGLFFSTIFTLTFIPCLLSLFLELGEWCRGRGYQFIKPRE